MQLVKCIYIWCIIFLELTSLVKSVACPSDVRCYSCFRLFNRMYEYVLNTVNSSSSQKKLKYFKCTTVRVAYKLNGDNLDFTKVLCKVLLKLYRNSWSWNKKSIRKSHSYYLIKKPLPIDNPLCCHNPIETAVQMWEEDWILI